MSRLAEHPFLIILLPLLLHFALPSCPLRRGEKGDRLSSTRRNGKKRKKKRQKREKRRFIDVPSKEIRTMGMHERGRVLANTLF